ncbi:MAG: extracellular solute-binding protein [Rhodospirillaceae bacterium]|nr:extracellular solute-binding protein [Rhodospirillaceae bacterium]
MPDAPVSPKKAGGTAGPAAEGAARARARDRTLLLAVILSVIVVALFGAYLVVTPDPVTRPESKPAPTAASPPAAPHSLTLIAPRSLIEAELLSDFETASSLSVNLVSYDNEESLLEVASGAAIAADVVLASGSTIHEFIRGGRLAILSARKITNLAQIDPSLRTLAERYDRGGLHAVPFAWTTYGLGVNRESVASGLGAQATSDGIPASWSLLFDPLQAAKLASCGIIAVDMPSIAFPVALQFLGLPPGSEIPNDIERASALWEGARPFIKTFDTAAPVEAMAAGTACLTLASAADVYRARALARDAVRPFDIDFLVPREGALLRVFMLAVPRTTPNTDRAMQLIDYLLRPEVSARMSNTRWFANAIPASRLYVRQEIKDDPDIYTDLATYSLLFPEGTPTPATSTLRARFWRLMSGGSAR